MNGDWRFRAPVPSPVVTKITLCDDMPLCSQPILWNSSTAVASSVASRKRLVRLTLLALFSEMTCMNVLSTGVCRTVAALGVVLGAPSEAVGGSGILYTILKSVLSR